MEGINNYKGVMLCSRPNEILHFLKEKPFCSRVDPKGQLGLNPVKESKEWEIQPKQKVNEALKRHKDWLEVFKLKMKLKKEMTEDEYQQDEERQQKIKELAAKNRERTKKMKDEFQKLNQSILLELDDKVDKKPKNAPLTENNLKKLEENAQQNKQQQQQSQQQPAQAAQDAGANNNQTSEKKKKKKDKDRPKWALTEKEQVKAEEEEVDDLLNFVDNLNYDKYIEDIEVNAMLTAIKNRVQDLKQQENWKEDMAKRYEEKDRRKKENDDDEDNVSQAQSQASQAKSVASERTQESIQSLKSKLEDKKKGKAEDWDKSVTGKQNAVNLEDRIAKLVADEVLRNYKNMSGVHSNQSIRKLLEKEAKSHLTLNQENEKYQGPNITIVKERTLRKNEVDPNNLPYMHRNPAI